MSDKQPSSTPPLTLAERILARQAPKPDEYEASLLTPPTEASQIEQDELEALLAEDNAAQAALPEPTSLAERIIAKKAKNVKP